MAAALPSSRCWFLFFIGIIGGFATATIAPYEGVIRALKSIIAAIIMLGKELLLPNIDEDDESDDEDSGEGEDVDSSIDQSDIMRKLQSGNVLYSLYRIWTPLFINLMILFNIMRSLKKSPV